MRHVLVRSGAVVIAGWSAAAAADDLTISSATTTAVTTAAAANNTPGNVTIAAGGSVGVSAGTAVTINSANTLTNGGAITNSGTAAAVGVAIATPGPFAFVNNAPVTLSGTAGGGDVGVALTGGATSGTIAFGTAGSVAVAGDTATGVLLAAPLTGTVGLRSVTVTGATSTIVALTAPLTGSLSLAGASSATTAGSSGVLIAAPVSGSVTNGGTITVGTVRGVDSTGAIAAGATGLFGVRIAASVGGGFVNDRYYVDANGAVVPPASVDTSVDTLITGSVVATGSAPALWVAPAAAGPQAIALGAVGTGDDAFAIVNRGVLETNIADVGLAPVALRVGGGGATTTLAGGIVNQATGSIIANCLDARVAAVDLLAGAVVPQLVNRGTIGATATALAATTTTAQGPGGAALGIVVEPGAALTGIVNTGTISVTATGSGNAATAILDQAGSVGSIVNSGVITAKSATGGGATRAIDLSAGTGPVTVVDSGTITGDVVLGQGATSLALAGGTVAGAILFGASAANSLALSGTGAFAGTLTTPTPIAVTLADTARLSLVGGPATVASIAATGASTLVVPVAAGGATALTVTGAASFTGTSTVSLALQSLALAQNVTVVTAGGGITTDHLPTLVDASSAPFLFTASAPVLTPTTLSIALTRKTAAEVGLTGGQAALFDASIPALAGSPAEAAAIANLPDAASVAAAYRQITPPSFGRAQLRTAQAVADTGFGAAAERLAILADRGRAARSDDDYGIGLWAQQYGDFNRQAAGANEGTFTTSTFGIAGGVDTTRFAHTVVGLGFVSDFATIHHDAVGRENGFNVPATTTGVEPYVAFTFHPLFVEATGLYAHVDYSATRTLAIGGVSDTVVSNWSGTQFGAGVNVGARLDFGHFRLTPSNALAWTSLRENGYTEQGAGAFALAVAKQTDTATTDTARLALAFLHPLREGLLKLEVHGGYTHQFDLKPTDTVAQFVSGVGSISLPGDSVHADEHSYGVDLGYTQDTIAFRGGFDRREAPGFRDQSVAVTATIGF